MDVAQEHRSLSTADVVLDHKSSSTMDVVHESTSTMDVTCELPSKIEAVHKSPSTKPVPSPTSTDVCYLGVNDMRCMRAVSMSCPIQWKAPLNEYVLDF